VKVTFTYKPINGTTQTPIVLALGQRLSPLSPVAFSHTGVAQAVHAVRAEAQSFIGRGGGSTTETFVAQQEHADYWSAMVWSRVSLSAARGKNGTLTYEGDRGGRIRLVDCVLIGAENAPGIIGTLSLIRFTFVGGTWING
jgi:hypothetical protein